MRILVQKFGGTSVADIDRLKMVRGKVKAALDQGYKVVVVLSAKSGKTNKLLDLSTRWAAEPDLAEVDSLLSTGEQASIALFSMLLKDSGIKARSMLGWQIPIITNDEFGRARILSIDASRIHKELEAHDVLVVAGFQGSTEDGRITTLGRGGSDTSAVALAAALDSCEWKSIRMWTGSIRRTPICAPRLANSIASPMKKCLKWLPWVRRYCKSVLWSSQRSIMFPFTCAPRFLMIRERWCPGGRHDGSRARLRHCI